MNTQYGHRSKYSQEENTEALYVISSFLKMRELLLLLLSFFLPAMEKPGLKESLSEQLAATLGHRNRIHWPGLLIIS